jgi:hypothetical protein
MHFAAILIFKIILLIITSILFDRVKNKMKKNTKIVIASLIFLLGVFFVASSSMAQGAGTVGKGGDCDTAVDCQSGLTCVPCASYGAKCMGNMCWTPQTDTGNSGNEDAYQVPPSNHDVGSCPDPTKEYRDSDGNCVSYGAGYETPSGNSAGTGTKCGSGSEEIGGVCFPTSTNLPDPSGGIVTIITNILYWMLSIFGILAIIAFIISGLQYILSTGNEETLDNAKRSMKWSVVGVAVALSGLVIIYAIDKMLRGYSNF